ncbi:hypothetical protein IAQ61_006666 [Plenodomus lingam]|uniref:Carboxypeptidase n=1 Tax=Leptosphaeria maculans (strain JN3 / isolate v23.1.3 / race Av1-4-5-6-7-8) TaxID=985895 RepID=E5AC79_LEPMJ|nr:similar to serine carboxypeptidase (CpdS) [Plenodomus lingam JN3]KAH9869460.1 hypothetical protein IAQ61_006666 [Plenodomus lingam]CBY02081.1 similar to serine carboxypeptidase (CpdS) [Plenodomus lingam JN3]
MKAFSVFASLLCASTALAGNSRFRRYDFDRVTPVVEKRAANKPFEHPEIQKRALSFLTNKTEAFSVNGTGIPEVSFDVGESYAGLLPISDDPAETRKLFFWFFPAALSDTPQEIVIWLNGGPGCSSLSGFLTENGPISWKDGTLRPTQNTYSWNNLTNVLWVEQPVGVGYSEGTPSITDEVGLANQFRGFYKNFVDTFATHNWKTYITGESYAGYYVPYIADSFISANDKKYFNLGGISINNPTVGDETVEQAVVLYPYVEFWQKILYLNPTVMADAAQQQKECGYAEYWDTYFKFPPPKGPFPVLESPFKTENSTCDMYSTFVNALQEVNPCFNIYHITDTCPKPSSVLGQANEGDYDPPGAVNYFNRTDVKRALHADVNSNWQLCATINVFGNGNATSNAVDASPPPANSGVLQRVIEYTNNTIIGSGELDFLLSVNGTLFALQNMTWNGAQGFSKYPSTELYAPYHSDYNRGSPAGHGTQGVWTKERGLTFYTARLAGHMLPGETPGVSFRMLEILLGRIKDFSSTEPFVTGIQNHTASSTQPGARLRSRPLGDRMGGL